MTHSEAWQAAKEAKVTWPEALAPPDLLDGYGGWYEDFWELSTERSSGYGAGPIPMSAIEAHVAGWRYDDADMFRAVIRAMDSAYMAIVNKVGNSEPQQENARDAFRSATSGRRK